MLINSLSTIIVPFWTKYILQKKLFNAHKNLLLSSSFEIHLCAGALKNSQTNT